jgi:uncharacterized membrane protein YesL
MDTTNGALVTQVEQGCLPPRALAVAFLTIVCFFILALSQALYRFRMHQAPMKPYVKVPFWCSASTYLQFAVTLELCGLLALLLLVCGLSLPWVLVTCSVLLLGLTFYREAKVRGARTRAIKIRAAS